MQTTALQAELIRTSVESMIRLVADHEPVVTSSVAQKQVSLYVQVKDADLGKVIGKQGRTARSLRTILRAGGQKYGLICELDVKGGL